MPEQKVTLTEFGQKVREMREAQSTYFRSRTGTALNKAKSLESQVDKMLQQIPEPPKAEQTNLFEL